MQSGCEAMEKVKKVEQGVLTVHVPGMQVSNKEFLNLSLSFHCGQV